MGAENANHSGHYTAANASHIRILLRDDNLGLGAQIGGNKAETFGLSLFSGVLGRLNGKSDVLVQKQQDALRDAELRQYQVGKYGLMNFVSGGLLVGDKIEKPGSGDVKKGKESKTIEDAEEERGNKGKMRENEVGEKIVKQKKRKAVAATDDPGPKLSSSDEAEEGTDARRKKKSERHEHVSERSGSDETPEATRTEKKSKKRRKTAVDKNTALDDISADEKARLKQEKRARKEDRRKRKPAKRLEKGAKLAGAPADNSERQVRPTPSIQPANGGRHAVRHRYIQQKRMAGLDAQAMKEIFMIKAGA